MVTIIINNYFIIHNYYAHVDICIIADILAKIKFYLVENLTYIVTYCIQTETCTCTCKGVCVRNTYTF